MISNYVTRFWDRIAGQPPSWQLALGLLRAAYGLYWLYAASWKVPPDFGRATDTGLWHWISQGIQYPTLAWYQSLLESLIIPNFTLFGYLVLLTELVIGLSLFLGAFTRLGAALGIAMSVNITLSVLNVPGEAAWFYAALISLHLLMGITRSGRVWGLDAHLAEKLAGAASGGNCLAGRLVWLT